MGLAASLFLLLFVYNVYILDSEMFVLFPLFEEREQKFVKLQICDIKLALR